MAVLLAHVLHGPCPGDPRRETQGVELVSRTQRQIIRTLSVPSRLEAVLGRVSKGEVAELTLATLLVEQAVAHTDAVRVTSASAIARRVIAHPFTIRVRLACSSERNSPATPPRQAPAPIRPRRG